MRDNGRVGIVALTGRGEPPPDFNPLDMNLFYSKGISLVAITGPEGDAYPEPGPRNPWESGYPLVLGARRWARLHRIELAQRLRCARGLGAGNKPGRFTMQLIDDGALRPSKIITHRLAVDEIPSVRIPPASRLLATATAGARRAADGGTQAYDMIYAREKERLGVVFEWDVSAERGAKL